MAIVRSSMCLALLSVVAWGCDAPTGGPEDGGGLEDGGSCAADLSQDPNNCGACGRVCPHVPQALTECVDGQCRHACVEGYDDCNGDLALDASDGCEADLAADPMHCGGCGFRCPSEGMHVVGRCEDRECSIGCEEGFADCDHDIRTAGGTGCEVDIRSDPENCGACRFTCSGACVASACEGEAPPCLVFSEVVGEAFAVVLATDGTSILVAWNDIEEGGSGWAGSTPTGRLWPSPFVSQICPRGESSTSATMARASSSPGRTARRCALHAGGETSSPSAKRSSSMGSSARPS